jgi:hypothetical protein
MVVGSPFTGFHIVTAAGVCVCALGGGCGWVEHEPFAELMLGTLLGPEETPWFGCVLGGRVWPDCLTHPGGVCGCGGGCGVGVWLCVECCIVDASILLCVSV